ncbi:NAD(P)/FAD-dependent oxidoreductase [Halobaculum sp. MBLA0143]|uniref:NAD(P)/FAD-dependent oxidoreductase n=1 Tax=Halobaculum sp. MBLA0143 TaxID=3079933 RepID=UPI0035237799
MFEQIVRRRMRDDNRVRLQGDTHVTGYLTDEAAETVTGVSCVENGDSRELAADLVVDATGRTSRTPDWLDDHGYESPSAEEVSVDLAYTTAVVERPPEAHRVVTLAPAAPDPRGGTAVPIEDDRWIVTLFGLHGEHAPTDPEGFEAYADNLSEPDIAQILLNHSYATDEIQKYPFPASLRRRYEQLDRFPDGLAFTGDAVASFNPIYGRGMSVAALDAMQLHSVLADGERSGLALDFFDGVAEVVDTAWRMAVGSDFDFDRTSGTKPTGTDLFNRYTAAVMEATHSDPVVAEQFYRVMRMEQPPTKLLRPQIAARVTARSVLGL